jgi:hypothetical protein
MNTFRQSAAFVFALTVTAAMHTAPASAMGHSGARVQPAQSGAQAVERQGDAATQAQIEALRKAVEELKAQLATAKG